LHPLQAAGEVSSRGTGNKVTVRVLSDWQLNQARGDAGTGKASREWTSGTLSAVVFILIKDDVDQTIRPLGKLME